MIKFILSRDMFFQWFIIIWLMAILIIYHHFQNEWHIYPLKKTNHSEISSYCNIRALTKKKNQQIKSDRQTSQQWSFRLSCLHLKSWTHISITTAQLEMTNKRFACSQNTSNPAPNLCTSGWQNFIRVFTSLLRAAKKHNLVIYYKASTASEIKLPKPTSSPSFELSVPRFIHTKGYTYHSLAYFCPLTVVVKYGSPDPLYD